MKKNGTHIFTVPFYQTDFLDEKRAILKSNGTLKHLRKPEYRDDPLRPEVVLAYTIFSLEMLCKLRKIGFVTKSDKLYKPWYGILGNNALVFEAIKA